ncbi:undecaprenyl-diphosphate phosphatase [Halopseudomonas pachastrellae]|nr:undecaprenyl-diphosphate phosphatase [Halopseudomonas pachastrellae]
MILGTIPVGLAGLLLKDTVETVLRSPVYLSVGLSDWLWLAAGVGGLALSRQPQRVSDELEGRAVHGCAQALALFPGTSRSGITMTAALMLGLSREASGALLVPAVDSGDRAGLRPGNH